MHLKFVNGYERKYNIGISTLNNIKQDIEEINKFVAFERAFTNQDDELEDEDWSHRPYQKQIIEKLCVVRINSYILSI